MTNISQLLKPNMSKNIEKFLNFCKYDLRKTTSLYGLTIGYVKARKCRMDLEHNQVREMVNQYSSLYIRRGSYLFINYLTRCIFIPFSMVSPFLMYYYVDKDFVLNGLLISCYSCILYNFNNMFYSKYFEEIDDITIKFLKNI